MASSESFRGCANRFRFTPTPEVSLRCGERTFRAQTRQKCAAASGGLFDHIVGEDEQVMWNSEAECVGGLEIDSRREFSRRLHWQILRSLTVQDSIDIPGRAAELIGDASCI